MAAGGAQGPSPSTVVEFLKLCETQGWAETMVALEQESGISLFPRATLHPSLRLVRELVLSGRWAPLTKILKSVAEGMRMSVPTGITHQPSSHINTASSPATALLLPVYRQQYLELLAFDPGTSTHPHDQALLRDPIEKPLTAIMNCLSQIQTSTTAQEYQELCALLPLRKVTEHPRFASWGRGKGRLLVWEQISKELATSPSFAIASDGPRLNSLLDTAKQGGGDEHGVGRTRQANANAEKGLSNGAGDIVMDWVAKKDNRPGAVVDGGGGSGAQGIHLEDSGSGRTGDSKHRSRPATGWNGKLKEDADFGSGSRVESKEDVVNRNDQDEDREGGTQQENSSQRSRPILGLRQEQRLLPSKTGLIDAPARLQPPLQRQETASYSSSAGYGLDGGGG